MTISYFLCLLYSLSWAVRFISIVNNELHVKFKLYCNPLDQFISTPLIANFKIAITSLDLGIIVVSLLMTFIFFIYVLGTGTMAV